MRDARFRFRDPSGSEQSLASVEELSARVEAGEVHPDTELFDAGAGGWSRAGDLPIFQFIVEELRMEGRLPEGFEATDPPPPPVTPPPPPASPPVSSGGPPSPSKHDVHVEGVEEEEESYAAGDGEGTEGAGLPTEPLDEGEEDPPAEPGEDPRPDFEELPLTPDPFEMHLPRTSVSRTDDETPPTEPSDPTDPEAGEPFFDDEEDDRDESADLGSRKGFGFRSTEDDRPRRPHDFEPLAGSVPVRGGPRSSPEERAEGAAGGRPTPGDSSLPAGEPETPGEIRSRPPPPRKDGRGRNLVRQRDRRRSMVVTLLLGGGLVIGVAIFALTAGNSDATSGASPGLESAGPRPVESVFDLPAHPLPSGDPEEAATLLALEGEGMAERMGLFVMESLDGLIDSIRVERELAAVPPPGWLGGSYLSAASDFDEVVEFWDDYEAFIRHLMEIDEALHLEAARLAWLALPGHEWTEAPEDLSDPRLDAFLAEISERHILVGSIRQTRYEGRLQVVEAARELHGFLIRNEDRIEYAPALGRGISRDPILEAVPGDEVTRRELDRQLDRLFMALDQTRQGVPPALGGLRTELFTRLREPI